MTPFEDLAFSPESFSGRARLFPLPNLVVFPHVMQPLHIFEPRYRAMLEDAVVGDGLIGMTLLAPGWETDYEGRPPLRSVGCLCRIATHHRTEEGSYNLLVLGLKRFRIVRELPPDSPFRVAEVRLMDDDEPSEAAGERTKLHGELLKVFKGILPDVPSAHEQLEQLLGSALSLGMLTDIVAYTLDIDLEFKEKLLSETRVDRRATMLIEFLNRPRRSPASTFPPEFSVN